jgi:predicted DNA-binding protein YlxM (UPF0122 family)
MKDFLNELADQDAISRNPFKAFAAYTALKFEDIDEKCKLFSAMVERNKDDMVSMKEKKLDEAEFNKFLRDYDTFKSQMKVYVVIATVIVNAVAGIFIYLLTGKL